MFAMHLFNLTFSFLSSLSSSDLSFVQSFTMNDDSCESKTTGKRFDDLYDVGEEVGYQSCTDKQTLWVDLCQSLSLIMDLS